MLITRIELENFKSYASAEIALRPGTIAIIGPNGAGKSTLLEAIGFALFGHWEEGMSLSTLLREGAASGRVVVTLISSLDERPYEVERCFSSRATTRYAVYDVERGRQRLVEGSRDVQQWLHDHLRVDASTVLSTLFRNTVGVPQGTFTAPFLEAAATRKTVFDPLLRVEEYKRASDNLLATSRSLEQEGGAVREQVARVEGQLARLPALRTDADALAQEVARLEETAVALKAELHVATAALTELDRAEQALREAAQSAQRAQTELAAQQVALAHAEQQLREAQEARQHAGAAQAGYEAYLLAESRLAELEEKRLARDGLRHTRGQLETERAGLQGRLEQLTHDLAQIETAGQQLVALAPLVERQEALEQALFQAQRDAHDLATAQRIEEQAGFEVDRASVELQRQQAGVPEAASLERTVARAEGELRALADREREARESRGALRSEAQRISQQSAALGRVGVDAAVRCPVCESELTESHRDELLVRNAQRMAALQSEEHALDGLLADCGRENKALASALARDRERLRALPTPEALQQLEHLFAQRQRAWEHARAEVARFEDVAARLEEIQRLLADLGDPRREYQRYEDQVHSRPAKESEAQQVQRHAQDLDQSLAELGATLSSFVTLDGELQAAQALRQQHRGAYDIYTANRNLAQQVDLRRQRMEEQRDSVRAARDRLASAEKQQEQAGRAYDAQQHEKVKSRVARAQVEQARCTAQSEERRKRHDDVCREVAQLQSLEGDLQQLRAREAELQELYRMVSMVRELLRNAGPHITRQLVRRISAQASVFYGEIIGDPSCYLLWSEDYELQLDVLGRKRSFRQLSGGEQMAAALALRLALLRETSAIDVAFFDEPTAHLDPERRAGLAEKIMQVKGFAQLFVISHDDTFEQAAQNYIRVSKGHDGSHAEAI